jgi:hypothetical protein
MRERIGLKQITSKAEHKAKGEKWGFSLVLVTPMYLVFTYLLFTI